MELILQNVSEINFVIGHTERLFDCQATNQKQISKQISKQILKQILKQGI